MYIHMFQFVFRFHTPLHLPYSDLIGVKATSDHFEKSARFSARLPVFIYRTVSLL